MGKQLRGSLGALAGPHTFRYSIMAQLLVMLIEALTKMNKNLLQLHIHMRRQSNLWCSEKQSCIT